MQKYKDGVIAIFRNIFMEARDLDAAAFPGLHRNELTSWDSSAHLLLLTCLEEEFGVKLDDDISVMIDSFDMAVAAVIPDEA